MINYDKAAFEAAFGTARQLVPSDIPEIAISGKSNVGKSSLINKLFNRKSLARVSSTPGKTATVNFFRAGDVRFADLPGYGYAKVSQSEKLRWSELMEGYFSQNRDIRLVIQLLDMRHTPGENDLTMLDYLSQTGYNYVIVLTKCDKLNKSEYTARMQALPDELSFLQELPSIIPVSSLKGTGFDELKALIEQSI